MREMLIEKLPLSIPARVGNTLTIVFRFCLFVSLAEFFRTIVHQLHKRKITTTIQSHNVHIGTRRISARRYRMEIHRLRSRLATDHRFN